MKKLISILILIFFFLELIISQPKIIFDTDFGGDADDLGALAMLHHFMDKEECELPAVVCWSTEQYAVPAVDAVNRFYNHPDIPVGRRAGCVHFDKNSYNKPLADAFSYKLTHSDVKNAVVLYREILAENEDKSLTIVVTGPLKNIENLLNSKADSISRLSGKELIEKKVKEFVIMGGQYPEGEDEWNFNGNMPGVTKKVIPKIPVPIVFSGYELGEKIKTAEAFNEMDKNTPLYVGFKHFSQHAPWMKDAYKGKISPNASYDQTAILYAVRGGVGEYWTKSEPGKCIPDKVGGNKWKSKKNGQHTYLKLKMPANELGNLIDNFMLGK